MLNIAIIGAGISGLTAANILKDDAKVTVFEKSRGVGGRMATRRAEPFLFDHGAQFFKARTEAFHSFIKPMLDQGIIQIWNARFSEFKQNKLINKVILDNDHHYVGVPGMNAIAKYLAKDIDVRVSTKIIAIQNHGKWHLTNELGECVGIFDWVISTAPAQQTAELMPESFNHHSYITSAKMVGCYSLMLGFHQPLPLDFDIALIQQSDISWISVNSSKPGRGESFSILVHSTNNWAELHSNDDREKVMEYLCHETNRIIGHDVNSATHKDLHHWRYANINRQPIQKILIDKDQKLAACGDWCIQGSVESAFINSLTVANSILKMIKLK